MADLGTNTLNLFKQSLPSVFDSLLMKIKLLHAHFLISTENYCNEKIGFTVELEEGETANEVVAKLREQAIEIVGPKAREIYQEKWDAERSCKKIKAELATLREEWDRMAAFLQAQGIKPNVPKMPMFSNLLSGVKPEEELVTAEIVDEDGTSF